jgi:hypothetical protein
MPIQLSHNKPLDPLENFGLLLIGPPKAGKTSTCLGFASPLAVLDLDRNFAGPLARAKKLDPSFEYYHFDPSVREDGGERAMEDRWASCMEFMKVCRDHPEIKTIVVDSLSPLTEFLMATILKASRTEKHSTVKVGGMEQLAIAHWQPFKNLLTQFITAGRLSGKTFIVTCHEDTLTTKDGAVIGYRPMIPGSLKNNLSGFFSDVWRSEIKILGSNISYKLRVAPKNMYQIGNSLGMKEQEFDVTNKTPQQIWELFAPYLTPTSTDK